MKISLLIICTFIFSTSLFALDYKEAKRQGLVKELATGYIVAKDPKASAIVKKTNKKRKVHYIEVAARSAGQYTASQIGAQMAVKLKAKK